MYKKIKSMQRHARDMIQTNEPIQNFITSLKSHHHLHQDDYVEGNQNKQKSAVQFSWNSISESNKNQSLMEKKMLVGWLCYVM